MVIKRGMTYNQDALDGESPPVSPRSPEKIQGDNDIADAGIELKPLVKGGDYSHNSDDSEEEEVDSSATRRHVSIETGAHIGATTGHVGTATNAQVAVNIFISFVGAGLLGQPYAFKQSGWLMGGLAVMGVSAANVYAMLLLVKTRKRLELSDANKGAIRGYGDIGRVVSGPAGENFVNSCLVISQVGFATAYIIFIAANLHSVFPGISRAWICFGCVPVLSVLVQVQDMKTLSPFSLIADVANLLGLSAVLLQDFEQYEYHHEAIRAVTNLKGVIYVASVAIYSLEGVNLVLPLESSCAERKGFPALLAKVVGGITALMVSFGVAGYVAFGSATEAPITLNLSSEGPWGNFVKVALSLALYLTYPVMMFPVGHVMEDNFASFRQYSVATRALVVLLTSLVAYAVPSFGKFLGLLGSSICMVLGFLAPSYFHLKVFERSELSMLEWLMDWGLIFIGSIMGVIGTYNSFLDLLDED